MGKRFCTLYIPTTYHKVIEPLNLGKDIINPIGTPEGSILYTLDETDPRDPFIDITKQIFVTTQHPLT